MLIALHAHSLVAAPIKRRTTDPIMESFVNSAASTTEKPPHIIIYNSSLVCRRAVRPEDCEFIFVLYSPDTSAPADLDDPLFAAQITQRLLFSLNIPIVTEDENDIIFSLWANEFTNNLVQYAKMLENVAVFFSPEKIILCNDSDDVCLTFLLYLAYLLLLNPEQTLTCAESQIGDEYGYVSIAWPEAVRQHVLPKLLDIIRYT